MTVEAPLVHAITGAAVMAPDGSFSHRTVGIAGGRFTAAAGDGVSIDGTGTWVIPGVYDCHSHITWSDFHAGDRARRSPVEHRARTIAALGATLRAGVVGLRDAGGAPAALREALAEGDLTGPRLQVAVDMIGAETAGDEARVRRAVETALDRGAQWIKLVATAGVGTPGGAVIDSWFSDREMGIAVTAAAAGGARVMVHAWGGRAIDAALDAGAASIEHGIFLTSRQAAKAASAGVTFVPTLTIYGEVQRMVRDGTVQGISPERIAEVLVAHRIAVDRAQEARLTIASGSDFGTADQHGRNLTEIASLMRAGLSSAEALVAATANGAALLGVLDGGRIVDGARADAVVLTGDPTDPATFEDPGSVAAVVQDGVLVHHGPTIDPPLPQQIRSTP